MAQFIFAPKSHLTGEIAMRSQVIEVFYGKHRVYEVTRFSTLLTMEYRVRTDDGKLLGTFKRLDEAVSWARERARKA